MAEAPRRSTALQELVLAQREYDAALAELRLARKSADEPGSPSPRIHAIDATAKELTESRAAVARAAALFASSYEAMRTAQAEMERSLDLLATTRAMVARGVLPARGSAAIERAERLVSEGRARLIEAGQALSRTRPRAGLPPS